MSHVRNLHRKAMELADEALALRLAGEVEGFVDKSLQAYQLEKAAADLHKKQTGKEPTRSILYKSAAVLAYDACRFDEAEKCLAQVILGQPRTDILLEARNLFFKIQEGRSLNSSVMPDRNSVQIWMKGPDVLAGAAPVNAHLSVLQSSTRLLYRTAQRLSDSVYTDDLARVAADLPINIRNGDAGYAHMMTVNIGYPSGQQLDMFLSPEKIINDLLECMDLFRESSFVKLKSRIQSNDYYRNFVENRKRLIPKATGINKVFYRSHTEDGLRVSEVSKGVEPDFTDVIGDDAFFQDSSKPMSKVEMDGWLLYADATRRSKYEIALSTKDGKQAMIRVPKSMMSDVVKPLWEKHVRVKCLIQEDVILLQDIVPVDEEVESTHPY